MTQEILIKRIADGDCTTPLAGKYMDKNLNRNVNLLTSYKIAYDRELLSHETLWQFLFNKQRTFFAFKWDSETDKEKEQWVAALLQHPDIQNPENKNIQGAPHFVLIDKRKKDTNDFQFNNNKVVVFDMVKNMEADELMDVAFFSMMNPAKERLSTLQIFNRLCDLNTGILMADAAKFLTDWKMPDASYQKVIRKAILLDIITSEKGIFKINNDIIGSEIDDLVAYMKSNAKVYEFVKSQVSAKDTLPYDVSKVNKVSEILFKKDAPIETKLDGRVKSGTEKADSKVERDINSANENDALAAAKIKMRAYNIKGWQSPFLKLETALSRILEHETQLAKGSKSELVA